MLSIDRAAQRERAAVGAFGLLPRSLQKALNDAARQKIVPMAVAAATRRATGTMRVIVSRGRYAPYKGTPAVAFGGTGIAAGRASGRTLVRGLEYGSPGRWRQQYTASSKGGRSFTVRRRTTRQFMPDRGSRPTTVTPAMEEITDDVLEVWTDIVEAAAIDAFDEGS